MTQLIVGLTGGVACGKTLVSDYLGQLGAYIIDTDLIARQVVEPESVIYSQIRKLLGDASFLADGHLNRKAVRERIFQDKALKAAYEAIILPEIRKQTAAAIENAPKSCDYIVLVVPLLFEKGMDSWVDLTVAVDLPEAMQYERASARDNYAEASIRQIMQQQLPRAKRNRLADIIIDNSGPIEKTQINLNQLHQHLLKLAQEKTQCEN